MLSPDSSGRSMKDVGHIGKLHIAPLKKGCRVVHGPTELVPVPIPYWDEGLTTSGLFDAELIRPPLTLSLSKGELISGQSH